MSWFSRAPPSPASGRFEILLRPHLDRLYRLAYRFTGSREDAEDLVQSLLIKLIPQEDRLAEVDILAPWLARSLYHLYVDQARRRGRAEAAIGRPISDAEVITAIADEVSESPEQAADRQFTQRRLAAALARLPADQRALIAWHDIEGYTLDELAAALGVPLGTLKSRLHRGRASLRRSLLEPSGGTERVYGIRTPA
jgi:RNA polymerase sigma-70 factor (ECF subfamily)